MFKFDILEVYGKEEKKRREKEMRKNNAKGKRKCFFDIEQA